MNGNVESDIRFLVGDRVKFRCDIKKGVFDGEVVEVIPADHTDEPTLLIHHLIPNGQNYHILQSRIVERGGNDRFEKIIAALILL